LRCAGCSSCSPVGHDQRRAFRRHIAQALHPHPEPLLVEQPGHRDEQPGVEFGIEAELVDLTLAGHLAPGELHRVG